MDIKMSQVVKIRVRPLRLTAVFNNMLTAPLYSYNFSIVVV